MLIYALIDPREPLQVRYVGKTSQDMQARLKHHIGESVWRLYSYPGWYLNSLKNQWIRSLLSDDIKPLIIKLSDTTKETWRTDEKKWISFWHTYCNLTNDKRSLCNTKRAS